MDFESFSMPNIYQTRLLFAIIQSINLKIALLVSMDFNFSLHLLKTACELCSLQNWQRLANGHMHTHIHAQIADTTTL